MRVLLLALLLGQLCLAEGVDFKLLQTTATNWLVKNPARVRAIPDKPKFVGPLMGWRQTFYVMTYQTGSTDEWVWLTPDKAGVWRVTGYRARRGETVLNEWGDRPKPLSTRFK